MFDYVHNLKRDQLTGVGYWAALIIIKVEFKKKGLIKIYIVVCCCPSYSFLQLHYSLDDSFSNIGIQGFFLPRL